MKKYTKIFRAKFLSELWGFANYNSAWVAWSRGWRPGKKELKLLKAEAEKVIKDKDGGQDGK